MKVCADCGIAKPLDDFSGQVKSKDGKYPYCKVCTSIRQRAAYAARGKRSWMNDKVCTWCGVLKPRTAYVKDMNGRLHPRCTVCEDEARSYADKGMRRCGTCKQWKLTTGFHPSRAGKEHAACIECSKLYYAADPSRARNRSLKKNYGITLEQYKQLLTLQNHKCPICAEAFDPNTYSYSVDHAHGGPHRGRIRAIVHRDCNRHVLWAHEDSRQLRAAADLIDHPLTDWMVPEHMINAYEKKEPK